MFIKRKNMKMLKKIGNRLRLIIKLTSLKLHYKDSLVFIAASGIGDLCYALSFIEDIKAKTNKKVVALTREYTCEALSAFPAVDKIIIMKSKDADFFYNCELPEKMRPVFNGYSLKQGVFICTPLTEDIYDYIKNGKTNYIDILKESLAELEPTHITYPVVPDIDIGRFSFSDINKTVIINPYSNSLSVEKTDLFEKIAMLLNNKGYSVYTNTVGNQKAVEGTQRLECTLSELYNISGQCAAFISIRSGILDFMIGNGGRYISIYDTAWNNKFMEAYSLKGWNTESSVYEFLFSRENELLRFIDTWLK